MSAPQQSPTQDAEHTRVNTLDRFWGLARRIAHIGSSGPGRVEFLHEATAEILAFFGCDTVEFWLGDVEIDYRWTAARGPEQSGSLQVLNTPNEPLNNILGFAQLLQKSAGLPPQSERDVAQIVGAALHGREVIRNLLLFARPQPRETVLVDLAALVREGVDLLRSRCERHAVELVLDRAPRLPRVAGDPAQLRQVIVNLAVNAIQAMPRGGRLTLRTDRGQDRVRLTVADTGVGTDEDSRRRLFVPFFTTKDVGEETGLGLSVVHEIVTSHRGAIHVESRPGQGATFIVSFPAADAAPS